MSVRKLRRKRVQIATMILGVLAAVLPATAVAVQSPLLATPDVLAGPSPNVMSLGGISMARDGTGGLVFLEQVDGAAHVFVSSLTNGRFQPPVQVDTGPLLAGASSQPVIGAGAGGLLTVAFINDAELYTVQRASSTAAWQAPQAMASNASNPSIQLNTEDGKAYLAFTAAQEGGHNVLVDYYADGEWTQATGPMNVVAGDDAGTGSGRPAVAAAGDGIGIVTWGEGGHLYARRVWGTSPSAEYEQLDPAPTSLSPALSGYSEVSAGDPAIGVGGNSSYVDIAFDETLQGPAPSDGTQTRVLLTQLVAEQTMPAVPVDGLNTPGSSSADQPAIAMNEYGRGFLTDAVTPADQLFAEQLGDNGVLDAFQRVDSLQNQALPYAQPAIAGLTSTLIAWQESSAFGSEIELRYAADGATLGPEQVVSDPIEGPTDAADGLAAAGDGDGDAAAAWVQGDPGELSIVAAQLFAAPGSPGPSSDFAYSRSATPVFSWSGAREDWGPVDYQVELDGQPLGQTEATSLANTTPLIDGPHTWQVTAANLADGQTSGAPATVWVDTTPPRLRVAFSGRPYAGEPISAEVSAADAPDPQEPGARASGIGTVRVRWGDGASSSNSGSHAHVYAKPGLYRVLVRATDRAGNSVSIARYLRILP